MNDELSTVVADEGENFLGWRLSRVAGGIHCRIWVLHRYDGDDEVDPATLVVPTAEAEFEDTLATQEAAVEYLAGEDVFLQNRARELVGRLQAAP